LEGKYEVRSIPTQIIYDAEGEEVFRHTGFWAKEDIDAKLEDLGILTRGAQTVPPEVE
jgi:thioredoxin 1